MTKSLIEKQKDGTIKLTVTLLEADVAKTHEAVIVELAKTANIAGFRQGKAPKKLVEERLNPDQIREEILKKLLPPAYSQAVQEHNLKPIMSPKIHIDEASEGQNWVFSALTCEMPTIDAGSYKENVKKVTAKSKIVVPGKEPQKPAMEEVVKAVLSGTKVQVPGILVEQETDRLLAQLLDDIKRLGLTLEQYLASTKRSADDLRAEYAKRATEDITLEFVLQKIAELEKITVEPKELDEAIDKAKSPGERQNLEANRYLLASILRQQKTLDFLLNL